MKDTRLLLQAHLRPAQGDRFQPTGFADIGAAQYQRADEDGKAGTQMLLVESAQSVANRLEKTCLDGDGPYLDPKLEGLPYVVAQLKGDGVGEIVTSSLVEAHRLGSPFFLKDAGFTDKLTQEMKYSQKGQINWKTVYSAFLKYDPNCLIHGVFLSLLGDGRVRVPRALSGFIEAEDVRPAQSGGVKNSPVDPKGEIQVETAGKSEAGIYSNVPYSRLEFVAGSITAYFNLDVQQIRSYGLSEPATRLLITLALLKVRRFLDSDLRLRTACILDCTGIKATRPEGFSLPAGAELLSEVKSLIAACKKEFADPAVTKTEVPVKKVPKADKKVPTNDND
jgi:CRISPR-associated protein Csb1